MGDYAAVKGWQRTEAEEEEAHGKEGGGGDQSVVEEVEAATAVEETESVARDGTGIGRKTRGQVEEVVVAVVVGGGEDRPWTTIEVAEVSRSGSPYQIDSRPSISRCNFRGFFIFFWRLLNRWRGSE